MLDLKQMMIDGQKNDIKLQQMVQLVRNGDKTDYSMKGDGGLCYKSRLCVLNVHELKKKLINESHCNTLNYTLVVISVL